MALPYSIRVSQTKYPDYPCYSFYEIEGQPNSHDAEKEARKRFCASFGFEYKDTVAYTFPTGQKQVDDLQYLSSHGLPDYIPS